MHLFILFFKPTSFCKIYFKYLSFIYKLFDGEFINNEATTKTYRRTIKRIEKHNIKLHWTVESLGFIKKALHHEVTPKFLQVKRNFINVNDKYKSEKCILVNI